MLTGGSASQDAAQDGNVSQFGSFVRSGVKIIDASPKKNLTVRILPAFDMSMSLDDEAFNLGFTSYRNAEIPEDDTNTPGFTDWFFPVQGYTFLGLGKRRFLSPLTGTRFYPAGHDPIRDCWKYIDEFVSDPEVKALAYGKTFTDATGREKKKPGYLFKKPRDFVLMNVLLQDEKVQDKWDNYVLVVTHTAMEAFRKDLAQMTPRSDKVVITEEWPDYLYGDVTHPEHGPLIRVTEKQIGNYTPAGFWLEQKPKSPETHNMIPFPVTEEQLKGRYRIFDTDNVTNLPSKEEQYQAILDYLIEDGVVPMEVITAACEKYAHVDPSLRKADRPFFEDDAGPAKTKTTYTPPASKPTEPATTKAVSNLKPPTPKKSDEDLAAERAEQEADDGPSPELEEGGDEEETPPAHPDAEKRLAELIAKVSSGASLTPAEVTEMSSLYTK